MCILGVTVVKNQTQRIRIWIRNDIIIWRMKIQVDSSVRKYNARARETKRAWLLFLFFLILRGCYNYKGEGKYSAHQQKSTSEILVWVMDYPLTTYHCTNLQNYTYLSSMITEGSKKSRIEIIYLSEKYKLGITKCK